MADPIIVELENMDNQPLPTDSLQNPTIKTVGYAPYQTGGTIAGFDSTRTRFSLGSGVATVGFDSTITTADDVRIFAGNATPSSAPFRVTEAGALTASDATITGSITATSGTIGGFTISATTIAATNLTLTSGAANTANITVGTGATAGGINSANAAGDIIFWGGDTFANRATAPFRVTAAGAVTGSDITITGGSVVTSVLSGLVGLSNTNLAAQGWTQTSVFSVTDLDTVAWGAGTFTSAAGTAYSIGAGNTGNMAARTYIYLDIAVSTTAYQTTTTAATAVGGGKVLVATAINGTNEATFQVFNGNGGLNISGLDIALLSITAAEIANTTITAGKIVAGTITGNEIAATTIAAGNIIAGTITTTQIAANTIVAGNIAAGTITTTEIAATTIVAGNIAASTITGTQISSLSVSGKTCTFDTGTIGGFTMSATQLTATNFSVTSGAANTARLEVGTGATTGGINSANAASDIIFWSGATFANRATAPFRVDGAGNVTGTSFSGGGIFAQNKLATIFEGGGRFEQTTGGGGIIAFNTQGVTWRSTSGASYATVYPSANGAFYDYTLRSSYFSASVIISTQGTDRHSFFGPGTLTTNATAGITYTGKHYGFKLNRASSVSTNSATNADGTTETATSIGGTETNRIIYTAIKNGTTNIEYYTDGSIVATHTTNLPSSDEDTACFLAVSNINTTSISGLSSDMYSFCQESI